MRKRRRDERGAGTGEPSLRTGPAENDKKMAKIMRGEIDDLPASWVRAGNGHGPVRVAWSGQPRGGCYWDVGAPPGDRPYFGRKRYQHPGEGLTFVSARSGTCVHEYMHHAQMAMPKLDEKFVAIHKRRTKNDPIVGLPGYESRKDVKGRPDKYLGSYFGREYPDGTRELATMSVQTLLHDSYYGGARKFMKKDPEMLDLVLGLLLRFDP